MIVNFSIENFGSIKDKQTLSFIADKSDHLEDQYVVRAGNGYRLLKVALIFGANASGKTTILKALDFLRNLVLNPREKKTDELDFFPFLFDPITRDNNSSISIEFIHHEIRYLYEIEFSRKAIISERLLIFNPNKALVFKRSSDLDQQFTDITLGSKIKGDKVFERTLEANTLWNNTVLGGFLKTNIDFKELKEVTDWFIHHLNPLVLPNTKVESFVNTRIEKSEILKADVVRILKNADFNISNILLKKEERGIPEGFIEFIEKQLSSRNDNFLNEVRTRKKVTAIDVEFEHTIGSLKYNLPFELESQGTKRYYEFAGLLSLLIKNAEVLPIDELESSLHPELYLHFLLSFLFNSKESQLIATTHNREILNNRDVFRNDAIWFTDKLENSSTELYSLADFDSSVIRDTSNIFNAYKSGRLKGTPNLGDYFINL